MKTWGKRARPTLINGLRIDLINLNAWKMMQELAQEESEAYRVQRKDRS